jgi:hypothetical protein
LSREKGKRKEQRYGSMDCYREKEKRKKRKEERTGEKAERAVTWLAPRTGVPPAGGIRTTRPDLPIRFDEFLAHVVSNSLCHIFESGRH